MSMYIEEHGDKNAPTIVFIHGGGISGWMWRKQREAFGEYHLLIPDLPEHGRSIGEGPITIEDCAERVAALIRERASGGKAYVVGHSLGGKIVVQLLSAHPELVIRAVVASAIFRPLPLIGLFLNMPVYRLTAWMMKNESVRAFQARQMGFTDKRDVDDYSKDNASLTHKILDNVYTQLNQHLVLPRALDQAQSPTLVLAGERELAAMRLSVQDIACALPHAKGFLMRGGRHTFPWEKSEAFNSAVRAWLEGKEPENADLRPSSKKQRPLQTRGGRGSGAER